MSFNMSNRQLVLLTQAAPTVGLSADVMHRAINRGEVPLKLVRMGGRRYVWADAFTRWRDSLSVTPAADGQHSETH